jgi:Na+-driven multidrug efflux pump
VALSFLALRLRRRSHVLAPDRALFAALKLDRDILRKVMRIGLPTGVQMVVISISELVVLALVNPHGSEATAAYGAVTQVVNYVQFPAISIAITASILGAQAIGAGMPDRVRAILQTGLALNAVITGSLILIGYALSHWLLGLFITQQAVRVQAEQLLHIMLWSLLLFGFQAVVGGIMRASGVVLVPVAISIACIVLVQVPAAYALDARYGLEGVWMAFPITYGAMLAFQTAYYKLVWKHKKIERLV